MRANCARKDGSDRMSLAWVCANCCRRERKTESCVSRACASCDRKEFPWEANCADVRRERSKAARPTPLRDMVVDFGFLCTLDLEGGYKRRSILEMMICPNSSSGHFVG